MPDSGALKHLLKLWADAASVTTSEGAAPVSIERIEVAFPALGWANHWTNRAGDLLKNPWVDKAIATVAIVPFIYPVIHHFSNFGTNIPELVYVI